MTDFYEVQKRITKERWVHAAYYKTYNEALNHCQKEGLFRTVDRFFGETY